VAVLVDTSVWIDFFNGHESAVCPRRSTSFPNPSAPTTSMPHESFAPVDHDFRVIARYTDLRLVELST